MHELSIAQSLIDLASEHASADRANRVSKIWVRIGGLAGVVREALEFSFEVARQGTYCEDAVLEIEMVPVTVRCHNCQEIKTLEHISLLQCPDCHLPTPEIVTGNELDLMSIEVITDESANP